MLIALKDNPEVFETFLDESFLTLALWMANPSHRICFTGSGLTINEETAIVALQCVLHQLDSHFVVYLLLGGHVIEYIIELVVLPAKL